MIHDNLGAHHCIKPFLLAHSMVTYFLGIGFAFCALFFLCMAEHMSNFHATSLYMGAWMGAITTTGSIIACGKLAELWCVLENYCNSHLFPNITTCSGSSDMCVGAIGFRRFGG